MRILASQRTWAVFLLPLVATVVAAAPVPAVDEKAEAEARLDAVLQQWAKARDAVQEAHFTIRVTESDSITDQERKSGLEVFVRKPDLMRIDCKKADGALEGSWLYAKGMLHLFSTKDKMESFCSLSDDYGFPEQPDRYPDGWLDVFLGRLLERQSWLAFGPPARDLKSRFDLSLTKDDHWLYLEGKPRERRDRSDVMRMQVVLNRESFQLRRLWIEQPDNTQTTYEFEPPRGGSEEGVTPDSILKGLPTDYQKVDYFAVFKEPNKRIEELLRKSEDKPAKP